MNRLIVSVATATLMALSLPKASNTFLLPTRRAVISSRSLDSLSSSHSHLFQYNNEQYNYNYDDDAENSNYVELWQQQQQQQQEYEQQQYQQQEYDQPQQQYYEQQQYQQQAEEVEPSLLITDNMSDELRRATSNSFDFGGGIDYLALARQRAMERRESINSLSSDEDWVELAKTKAASSAGVEDDGWESSLDDTGSSSDSEALGLGGGVKLEAGEQEGMMVTESGLIVDVGVEGDEEDGPRLIW
ncbi:hypothetical protein ACHAXH_001601 [Discostella pseudostelligera]|jgi:hypothetical protein